MAAQKLATDRFEGLVKTEGFMRMGEDALSRLLEDDNLAARNEMAVCGCVKKLEGGGGAGARAWVGG